jgi:hypothetical protein
VAPAADFARLTDLLSCRPRRRRRIPESWAGATR